MLIIYDSMTGKVRNFVSRLNMENMKITEGLIVNEPFVIVTYTTGFGQVPRKVINFLRENHSYLQGVAASGNKNWGDTFAMSANVISEMYNVPIIHKFELSGSDTDIIQFTQRVGEMK